MVKAARVLGLLGTAALVMGACSSSSRDGFGAPQGTGASGGLGGSSGGNLMAQACEKMDIVFVIDDSASMAEEQANLTANFPKFISVLDAFQTKSGALLDYRIAVTTTGRDTKYLLTGEPPTPGVPPVPPVPADEKGDNGAFATSCGGSKRWVDKSDPGAASTFTCRADVGTNGPSLEMPLYALKLAFTDRVADGTNAGFLREDALLAVVILTDEDDCSREDNNFTIKSDDCPAGTPNVRPVAEYAAMLDATAKGPGRWAAAVMAGDKACKSAFGNAEEATRLKQFASIAGKNGSFISICDGDLSDGLQKALDTFDAACRTFAPVR